VAPPHEPWQAGAVLPAARRVALVASAAALVALAGPPRPGPAQQAGGSEGEGRPPSFQWTLYPGMWAELDVRLGAGAEAVAEVRTEGGEVSWDLHTHPPDAPPTAFVTLERGRAASATIRCAPTTPGWYSVLLANDAGAATVRVHVELWLRGDARLTGVRP